MIPKAEFWEWIENYCQKQLNENERKEFEEEVTQNRELREEFNLHKEIFDAIGEKDIINLRDKLQIIYKENEYGQAANGRFELLGDFVSIEGIREDVPPEELINYYDSLPKVHVYQHEINFNENIHEYYKEQDKSGGDEDLFAPFVDGEDLDGLKEFEGLGEAILEQDVISLREKLFQMSKSVKPQYYSTEDIDRYLDGELAGEGLLQFENELENNRDLKQEVELHCEMENALKETDILKLRNQLDHIMFTETSWNASEIDIEKYIDGELRGEELDGLLAELGENTGLVAEVNMRKDVDKALGEKDILALRESLTKAHEKGRDIRVKSIVPPESDLRTAKTLRRLVAVLVLLMGLSGALNMTYNSIDKTYDSYYKAPQWSPERSLTSETSYQHFLAGSLCFMNGEYGKAIENYNMAIKNENEKYAAHFYKGASLQQLDRFEEAIPEYSEVIKHANNLFIEEAKWNKALCYIKLKELDKAKTQLTGIIDENSYYKKDAKAILRRLRYSFW